MRRVALAQQADERPGGSRKRVVVRRYTPRSQFKPSRTSCGGGDGAAYFAPPHVRQPTPGRSRNQKQGANARACQEAGAEEQGKRKARTYPSGCGPPVASMGFTAAAVLCAAPVAAAVVVATADTSGNCWRKLASRSSPGFRVLVLKRVRASVREPPSVVGRASEGRRACAVRFVGAIACDLGRLCGGAP